MVPKVKKEDNGLSLRLRNSKNIKTRGGYRVFFDLTLSNTTTKNLRVPVINKIPIWYMVFDIAGNFVTQSKSRHDTIHVDRS